MKTFSLNVKNISKRYGSHRVFDDLSFAHAEGVLGIAGPNGSGKSTLLQCLTGLKSIDAGSVEWRQGGESRDLPTVRHHAGYAAPYINLYPEFSCAENLDFILKLRGSRDRAAKVQDALRKVNLQNHASRPYGQLSTGQQQRLRLASALVHQPAILFLDEPGSNLDRKGRTLVAELVGASRKEGKLTFLASNNPAELQLCDRVYSVEKEEEHVEKESGAADQSP